MEVFDLDILKPKSRKVKLAGKEIDVSFIPCGITFQIDQVSRDLANIDQEKIAINDDTEIKKAFDLAIKLCCIFCTVKYPDMDEKWFKENVNAAQVQLFASHIKQALIESYKGVEEYGKNG